MRLLIPIIAFFLLVAATPPRVPASSSKALSEFDRLMIDGEKKRRENNVGEADASFRAALHLALKSRDRKGEAAARNGIARTFPADRWSVLAQARLALAIHRELHDQAGEASDLATVGTIYQFHGFSSAALPPFREAMKIEQRLGLVDDTAEQQEAFGLALAAVGSYEEALTQLREALAWKMKHPANSSDLVKLEVRLGSLEASLGRYEQAAAHMSHALGLIEAVRSRLSNDEWTRLRDVLAQRAGKQLHDFGPALANLLEAKGDTPDDLALVEARRLVFEEGVNDPPDIQHLGIALKPTAPPRVSRTSDFLADPNGRGKWKKLIEQYRRNLTSENPQMTAEQAHALMHAYPESVAKWLVDAAGQFNEEMQTARGVDKPSVSCLKEEARQLNQLLKENDFKPLITEDMIAARSSEEQEDTDGEKNQSTDALSGAISSAVAQVLQTQTVVRSEIAKIVKPEDVSVVEAFVIEPCERVIATSLRQVYARMGDARNASAMNERAWKLTFDEADHQRHVMAAGGLGTDFSSLDETYAAAKRLGLSAPADGICDGIHSRETPGLWHADLVFAQEHFEQALQEYRSVAEREPSLRPTALTRVGEVYEKTGDRQKAVQSYAKAIEAVEAVEGNLRLEDLVASWASSQASLYARTISLLFDLGKSERAFEVAERARGRAFLNQIGNRRLPAAAIPADLASELQMVRQKLIEIETLRARPQKSDTVDQMFNAVNAGRMREETETRARFEELRDRLRQSHPEYLSLVQVETTTIPQIQREVLSSDMTLIEYFVLGNRTLAWVVDRERAHCVELKISADTLRGDVTYFRDLIAQRSSDEQTVSARLREVLIAPLERYIRHPSLVIVPHGPLHYLPFAALWSTAKKHFLIEDYTITVAPSASTLRFMRKSSSKAGPLVVFGNPDGSLPEAEHEARTVAVIYGVSPFLGNNAQERQLREACPRATMLHVAAHAHYDPERPLFTKISLAPTPGLAGDEGADGQLHLYEVYDLDLRSVRLAVLSACDTALGPRDEGDDLTALPRAFLNAGASAVVTTLWHIDDASSAAVMQAFYRRLHDGASIATALRVAQLEILKQSTWHAPYYWAAFMKTGEIN